MYTADNGKIQNRVGRCNKGFYRLIYVDKLSSEYREVVLNMVDMALFNDAQSSKDIADIIMATQMINTISREIVMLYEGAMKERLSNWNWTGYGRNGSSVKK